MIIMNNFFKIFGDKNKIYPLINGKIPEDEYVSCLANDLCEEARNFDGTVNSIFLGFAMGLDTNLVIQIIIGNYIVKLLFAAIDTPLVYLCVNYLKKNLSI